MFLKNSTEKKNNIPTASEETVRRMRYSFGTFVEIEAAGKEREETVEAVEAAFSEMRRVESLLSKYSKESPVYKINQCAAFSPMKIDLEVFQLLEEAIRFSQLTNGAFDIAVGAIMELWDLAQKKGFIPGEKEIEKTRENAVYKNISLDPKAKTIFFEKPGMKIDLGGIGKGYAIDRAIEILKRNTIKRALINAGGNIFCLDEDSSAIGIKNPLKNDEIICTVLIKDGAISTSANYERFFSIQKKTYGHLINPGTGFPARNGVLSVSIICPSARAADAMSTAIFILGYDKGMELIDYSDNLEGIIITKNGRRPQSHVSLGLKEVFPLTYLPG